MIWRLLSWLLRMGYPEAPPSAARLDPEAHVCWRCEVAWTGDRFCWVCGGDVRYQPAHGGL